MIFTRCWCSICNFTCYARDSIDIFYLLHERLDGWETRWVKSDWKKDENTAGEWNYTSGKWNGDPNDKGMILASGA